MDMIKERKISFVDNTLRKAEGEIQNISHFLYLKKEAGAYVITLHETKTKTRLASKLFRTNTLASLYFDHLVKKHSFIEIPSYPGMEATTKSLKVVA